MLTKEELIQLNNQMLSLGRPDDRDYMGYNKPDYALMFNLAYIPAENLKDEYVAVLVDTLNHYGNTQLMDYSDELNDTWEHYSLLLQSNRNDNFLGYIENHNTSFLKNANEEWLPKELKRFHYNTISLSGYNGDGVYLSFEDVRLAHSFKNATDGVFYRQLDGEWKLFVPYKHLERFVELMATAKKKGIDGYVPSDALQEVLKDISSFSENAEKKEREALAVDEKKNRTVFLVDTDFKTNSITVHFNSFSPEMNHFKNEHPVKVKIFNECGKWNTKIAFSLVDEWKNKALSSGLFLSEEMENVSTSMLREKAEGLKQKEEEAFRKKHKNTNNLVDLRTIPLPFNPFKFQIEDTEKLLERDRMLIGHEMGCGKTFISGLVGTSITGKKLVICPESLRLNWQKELNNIGHLQQRQVFRKQKS